MQEKCSWLRVFLPFFCFLNSNSPQRPQITGWKPLPLPSPRPSHARSCLVWTHDGLGVFQRQERLAHLSSASSFLDLVLEVFNKRLKGQSVLPLETRCHFVLLYHEDAADLGQKPPWKPRAGLRTGQYLRPHRGSTSDHGQSPAKVLKNSSKKPGCSREKVASLPRIVNKLF